MQELQTVNKGFDEEIRPFMDDLFCPDASDWTKMATEFIESYYKIKTIPSVSDLVEGMLEENINNIHGIVDIAMRHKVGSVLCDSKVCGECRDCPQYDECYENILEECLEYEFCEETSPLRIAWGLYEILYQGKLCIYMDDDDLMCYGDLLRYYDYDNEDLLWNYFKEFDYGDKPKVIINHAQQTMFDELYTEGIGNCFNYSRKFILIHDSFDKKYSEDYYLEDINR